MCLPSNLKKFKKKKLLHPEMIFMSGSVRSVFHIFSAVRHLEQRSDKLTLKKFDLFEIMSKISQELQKNLIFKEKLQLELRGRGRLCNGPDNHLSS